MAVFPMTNIIRGTFDYTLGAGAEGAQNVFHFGSVESIPDAGTLAALMPYVRRLWDHDYSGFAGLAATCSDQTRLVSITLRTIDPLNPVEDFEEVGVDGTVHSSRPVPFESAVVTTLYTDLSSRRGRGRTFLPGLDVTGTAGGKVGSGTLAAIQGQYDAWVNDVADNSGCNVVVWSPTNNTGRSVLSCVTRDRMHHQRRRNR